MNEDDAAAQPNSVSLYLRVDGTLLLVRGSQVVEITLSPRQLLALGVDALRLAAANEPLLLEAAAEVLSTTHFVVPMEGTCPNVN